MSNGKTIYHVSFGDDANHYFGSLAAIFTRFTPSELGVSLARLYDFGIAPGKPYRNGKYIIRKGTLFHKRHAGNVLEGKRWNTEKSTFLRISQVKALSL